MSQQTEPLEEQEPQVVARVERSIIKDNIAASRTRYAPSLVHSVNGVQEGADAGTVDPPSADLLQSELVAEQNSRAASGFSHTEEVVRANLPQPPDVVETVEAPEDLEVTDPVVAVALVQEEDELPAPRPWWRSILYWLNPLNWFRS